MSRNYSKIIVEGHLGKDPEAQYLSSGVMYVKFTLAVNRSEKKDEEWVDVADWYNVEAYGRTAEYINEYLEKGSHVLVEGQMKSYRGTNDVVYWTLKASDVTFL